MASDAPITSTGDLNQELERLVERAEAGGLSPARIVTQLSLRAGGLSRSSMRDRYTGRDFHMMKGAGQSADVAQLLANRVAAND